MIKNADEAIIEAQEELPLHCMLDIETLGITPQAPIIQIALVFFNIKGITATHQWSIKFEDALKHGTPSASTIQWWMQQPKEAQDSLFTNQENAETAVKSISAVVKHRKPDVFWAHATFDFPILQNFFNSAGESYPIYYRTSYDLRSLEYIADANDNDKPMNEGIAHNALSDAIWQAKYVINLLKKLGRK